MSWETAKLGDVTEVSRGTTITKKQTVHGNIPVIGGGMKPTYFHNEFNRDAGVITISGSGASAGFVNYWEEPIFASDCSTVQPFDKSYDKKFLYFFLLSQQQFIYENFRSGAAQPHVYAKDIATLDIPKIDLTAQKQIVEKLDAAFADIDKAIRATEKNIANVEAIFYQSLDVLLQSNARSWQKEILKNISLKIGSGATPRGGKSAYKDSGIPLVRSMNIHDLKFENKNLAYLDNEQAEKLDNAIVKEGDTLFNITGASIARCAHVPEGIDGARVNQHVMIIRPNPELLLPEFLTYLLVSPTYKKQLLQTGESAGATRQAITKGDMQNLEVFYPAEINHQEKIVNKIKTLHINTTKAKEIYLKKVILLGSLKSSMLNHAFSGELTKDVA